MDLKEGDVVASLAVVREGQLSKADIQENGQASAEDVKKSVDSVSPED
jgi:hypothetical protein